jgi:hypothetical protein
MPNSAKSLDIRIRIQRILIHKELVASMYLIAPTLIKKSGAKSYMRKGFLMYEKMRKYFTKYEEAVSQI